MNWPIDFGEWALFTVCLAAGIYLVADTVRQLVRFHRNKP